MTLTFTKTIQDTKVFDRVLTPSRRVLVFLILWLFTERKPLKSGNCDLAQLTAHGAKQMEAVGREIRKKYVEQFPLLPPTFDPSKMFIRSTYTKRTIETAYQIIQGLYPEPHYRNPDGNQSKLEHKTKTNRKWKWEERKKFKSK